MSYYDFLSSEQLQVLKNLNDKVQEEEKKNNPNKSELLKLKQKILMTGIEMFAGVNTGNYNPYKNY